MKFIIHAVPKPKGRPRVKKNGRPFTPERTREYEQLLSASGKSNVAVLSQ